MTLTKKSSPNVFNDLDCPYFLPLGKLAPGLPTYNPKVTFNPGTAVAPWSGFSSNVNKESELRNMFSKVRMCKPKSSRPESIEIFILGTGKKE